MQPLQVSFALRVLVVEDEHDSADTLALLLRHWGYQAVVAYDGPSALDLFSLYQPDVVLLDIAMPSMDGWELARRLRRLPGGRDGLLIAVTGYAYETDLRCSEEGGIDLYFLKPVDPAELEEVLMQAGSLGRQRRQLSAYITG
jgi:two-component system CheB/CheR fusion protein